MNANGKPTPRSRLDLLLLTLLLLAAPVAGAAEELPPPIALHEAGCGSLLLKTAVAGAYLPAPTLATDVRIRISGFVARTEVRQRFRNPTADWVEGVYVFPLPEGSAVDTLEMVVGERRIVGEIREREEARREYEVAKNEGRKASLLEQERPNLFTSSVANLGPDEEVEVRIEYQEELRYDQGSFRLRFPMVVGPRYTPDAPTVPGTPTLTTAGGTGWVSATSAVPDAPRITPAALSIAARPAEGILNPVRLRIDLDAGVPLTALHSPSHVLVAQEVDTSRYEIELAASEAAADRDFTLEWTPARGATPQAALFTEEVEGEIYALLMVVPPAPDRSIVRLPREVIFVLDTSGSMHGASIEQARAALDLALARLEPPDLFNVVQFNSTASSLHPAAVEVTPETVDAARRWVAGLEADGGTEMLPALRLALGAPAREGWLRQIVFVTDGCVGNEDEIFAEVRATLGEARLFTVGIGSAPNSHFMRQAAQWGRGTFTYVGQTSEVAAKMGELLRKLESPVLSDVEAVWADAAAEAWPPRLPDLYLGETLAIAARLRTANGAINVRGQRDGLPWDARLESRELQAPGIAKLWARRKIGALSDSVIEGADAEEVKRAIVQVALAHHLVTRHTSLVAVDLTPTAPAGVAPQTRPIPVSLPAGWSQEHVLGELPQGGTSARLAAALAATLLLAAALLWRLATRERAPAPAGG